MVDAFVVALGGLDRCSRPRTARSRATSPCTALLSVNFAAVVGTATGQGEP
jgi:hypothetical protein